MGYPEIKRKKMVDNSFSSVHGSENNQPIIAKPILKLRNYSPLDKRTPYKTIGLKYVSQIPMTVKVKTIEDEDDNILMLSEIISKNSSLDIKRDIKDQLDILERKTHRILAEYNRKTNYISTIRLN